MLTPRQQEILQFIKRHVQQHQTAPSHNAIMQALNISSCSYLDRILHKLEKLELIRRNPNKARNNIELLQSPYTLPLIGKIAAGLPIEAVNQPEEINILQQLLGNGRYLLEVKGDSMIDDGIHNGDWIICESCQKVPNGTIVVALINRQDATLKRINYLKDRIGLEPANKNYQTQYYKPEEVELQGKYIGIIRLKSK